MCHLLFKSKGAFTNHMGTTSAKLKELVNYSKGIDQGGMCARQSMLSACPRMLNVHYLSL